MNRLKEAMMLLIANDAPLGPEWLDHPGSVATGRAILAVTFFWPTSSITA